MCLLAPWPLAAASRGVWEPAAPIRQDQQPQQAEPAAWEPIVRSYIIVQAKPGYVPAQLQGNRWTLMPVQQPGEPGGALGPGEIAQVNAFADAALERGVSGISAAFQFPFANEWLADAHGLNRYYLMHVPQGSDTPAIAAQFAQFDRLLDHAMVDVIGGIASIPNDASFALQWNMHNTGQNGGTPDADVDAPECWDVYQGSTETVVAVLDTGVQQAWTQTPPNPDASTVPHPELVGKVISGWDFNDNNANTTDYNGHGTHCAGSIAALANNGVGIAGLNWNCKVLSVKVVNDSGSGNATTCANGVTYAADNGADIISMSLQYYNLPAGHPLQTAVAYAYDNGVLPIAASGNFAAAGTIAYPAKYPKCMAIGATNKFDQKWSGSNSGLELDVVAPGQDVYSLWKLSGYLTNTGTSMATPHVAALASLMRARNPALTLPEIEQIMKDTAKDLGAAGWDTSFGWGRISAHAAMLDALPACVGNTNADALVDVSDLLAVINGWGVCPVGPCAADITGDGLVDVSDLLEVISNWGPCP